jgi:hypothetical protein
MKRRKTRKKGRMAVVMYYVCLAVVGFFIIGGLHVREPVYVLLGLFNLVVAPPLGRYALKK